MLDAIHVAWRITEGDIEATKLSTNLNLFETIAKRELDDSVVVDCYGVICKRNSKGTALNPGYCISFGVLGNAGDQMNRLLRPERCGPATALYNIPKYLGREFTVYLLTEPLDLTLRGMSAIHSSFLQQVRNYEAIHGTPWGTKCPAQLTI